MLKKAVFFILFFLILSTQIHAASEKLFLIAPACLVNNLAADTAYKTLASASSLLLLEINHDDLENFIEAKHKQMAMPCGGFIDVTESWQKDHLNAKSFLKKYIIPSTTQNSLSPSYAIQYSDQVHQIFNLLNPEEMWTDLTAFSDTKQFPDRFPNSSTGINAAKWLRNKIETIALNNQRDDVTIYTVTTGTRFQQPSLVMKIGDSRSAGIVIGAHMDTLKAGIARVKPGADDDGSGSVTLLALAKALLASGIHFKKPIYLIWYAAEEQGLVGSQYVVQDFVNKNIPIDAVLQLDMTGYAYKNESTLWLVTDYIDADLSNFLAQLISTYVQKPVDFTKCGYACSDHASWTRAKFKAAFPTEAKFGKENPYIHTSRDTINLLSLSHMTDFAKLALAFAVELAEPLT